jgi:hypothetical protein
VTTFVAGLNRENARALLAIAEDLGLPRESVQTQADGFNVPDEIGDRFAASLVKKAEPVKKASAPPPAKKAVPAPRTRKTSDKE